MRQGGSEDGLSLMAARRPRWQRYHEDNPSRISSDPRQFDLHPNPVACDVFATRKQRACRIP